jgi:predicted nuclease of predicted toxin-antitoxin system
MRGASDTDVFRPARREDRILLTEDKDFEELVYRLHRTVPGIILLRFPPEEKTLKKDRLLALLDRESERLRRSFIVLDADKARIRPLE